MSCGGRDSPPPPPTASFSWPAATTRNVEKEKKKYTRVEINKVKNKREKNNKPQATHASQQQQQQEQQMKSFSWFSLSLSLCLSPSLPGPFFRSFSTFQSLRDCYRVFFLSSAPSATGGRRVALGRRRRLLWATPVDLKKMFDFSIFSSVRPAHLVFPLESERRWRGGGKEKNAETLERRRRPRSVALRFYRVVFFFVSGLGFFCLVFRSCPV